VIAVELEGNQHVIGKEKRLDKTQASRLKGNTEGQMMSQLQ
jgi:hypothetical protein